MAYPVKPADWGGELARIEAKLSEPGRMKALQAMCKTSPGDAAAQLPNVACPVLVIEGSLDPDWANPRAEGEKIIADLTSGLGELAVTKVPATTRTPRRPMRSSRWPCHSWPRH